MPAPPEQALAVRLTGSGRAVLDALWRGAQVEPGGVGWTPVRTRDLAEATRFSVSQVERALADLRNTGLIDRATRPVAGAQVPGWRLLPVPLRPARVRVATRTHAGSSVANQEKSHRSEGERIEADLAQISQHARPRDSALDILQRLAKARAPCSSGRWHRVKVFRRIERMAEDLGLKGKGLRAGDIVQRWKRTREG